MVERPKERPMTTFSLVYTSKALHDDLVVGGAAEIDAILATARRRNPDFGVRGALLFTEGRFVQVLEGEQAAVKGTFDRIVADPRHHDVEVLCSQFTSKARFNYWSMAFVGDSPALRQRYANAPLATLGRDASGDSLLDFMLEVVRSPT
jgi:hypothetical protein